MPGHILCSQKQEFPG